MIIRSMKAEDIDGILALEEKCFKTPWSRRDFEEELKNELALYIVCDDNGTIAGYMGAWLILDEAHITNVAVSPDYRRLHIATCMMQTMIDAAEKAGVSAFTLEVRPSNDAALSLYRGFGFREEGRRKGYYVDTKEDAIIMWRRNDAIGVYNELCSEIKGAERKE